MNTHTLKNKSKITPILTFSAKFFELVLAARPESVTLALGWFNRSYKSLTGKTVVMAHEQQLQLLQKAGANEQGIWISKYTSLPPNLFRMKECFVKGFMQPTSFDDMHEALMAAEVFYDGLDLLLAQSATPIAEAGGTSEEVS